MDSTQVGVEIAKLSAADLAPPRRGPYEVEDESEALRQAMKRQFNSPSG